MRTSDGSDPLSSSSGYLGRGGELYYAEVGVGRSLVVIHGGPDFNHAYLRPELDRLSDRHRVIYYDQRGRGRSRKGVAAAEVSMVSEIADLEDVRQHFGAETVALIGHSWGGLLAMEYALLHGSRVSHLILMNSAPASHTDWLLFRRHLEEERSRSDKERMESVASSRSFARGHLLAERNYYLSHFRMTLPRDDLLDELVRRVRRDFTSESVLLARAIERRLYEETWERIGYDLFPRLRSLDLPTLVIHGTNEFIPVETARRIADAIPGAEMTLLVDRGHLAYMESPDEVCGAVASFIKYR